jgi:hypothetical protein
MTSFQVNPAIADIEGLNRRVAMLVRSIDQLLDLEVNHRYLTGIKAFAGAGPGGVEDEADALLDRLLVDAEPFSWLILLNM